MAASTCKQSSLNNPYTLSLLQEDEKYQSEEHLLNFTTVAWPIINPATTFLPNWHIELICEYLMAVTLGEIKRLIINIPPRYAKSTLVSQMWPCWEWLHIPSQRWVFASYASDLSVLQSIKRKDIILSDWYRMNWSEIVKLREDHNRKADFVSTKKGAMYSTSIGGQVTGMGGNRLVIDDPTSPQEAESEAMREMANTWYSNTFQSRLDDKQTGSIVLIQQRLHQNDMTGYLTGLDVMDLNSHVLEGEGWTLLRIPLISEQDEDIYSPIGNKRLIVSRKEGDLLWPEREGMEQIKEYQKFEYIFASQQQQRPSPKKGAMFERDWVQQYDHLPPDIEAYIMSIDATFKGGPKSAFVAIQVWAWKRPNMYFDYQVREKMSFTKSLDEIINVLALYPGLTSKLIEEAANGDAIIDVLSEKIGGIVPVRPVVSKESRASSVTPLFRSGNVYVKKAPWTHAFINELLNFPGSTYKDQVDAMSQAIYYIQEVFGGLGKEKRALFAFGRAIR